MTDTPAEAALAAYPLPHDDEPYAIIDDGHASWALRKIAALDEEEGRADYLAKGEHERIDRWRDDMTAGIAPLRDKLRTALNGYWQSVKPKAEGMGRKSYRLLGGKIGEADNPPKLVVEDEDAAVTWLHRSFSGECVKSTVDKAALKALVGRDGGLVVKDGNVYVADSGERVPGVRWETSTRSVIEPAKETT